MNGKLTVCCCKMKCKCQVQSQSGCRGNTVKHNNRNRIRYYKTFADDFVESKNQAFHLPEGYVWIQKGRLARAISLLLFGVAWLFGQIYCRFVLHATIENRRVLRGYRKQGYFLYGNHTQPIGDVFQPARVTGGKRTYVVASPANLGIPVLGRLLPGMGALPIPDSMHNMRRFWDAVRQRYRGNHCVVIYPEAHVWPYCTQIRPFSATAFRFPIEEDAPCFCMTTTYQKRQWGTKPKITVYVDGPFFPDKTVKRKQRQQKLCDAVFDCMQQRSKSSTYAYIRYEKETKE